jgi:TBC1 domain family member 15
MRFQLQTLDHLVQLLDPQLYLHLQEAECTNFFFFFRMMLVWYKREFEWMDIQRLWEVLWTDYLSANFHLFIALAILEKHRDVIMTHLKVFDDILKYINELSGTIDLESTLVGAERLFRRFERTVEAVDRKDTFPAPRFGRRRSIGPASPSVDREDTCPTPSFGRQDRFPTPRFGRQRSIGTGSPTTRVTPALLNKPAAPESSSAQQPGDATASTTSAKPAAPNKGEGKSVDGPPKPTTPDAALMDKVISPELRSLLSREAIKPKKKKDAQKQAGSGDGVGQ